VRGESLKRIVLGGEKVSDGLRRKLRELAAEIGAPKVDILATYGFTEAKLAWAECPFPHDGPPSGYHLYPDLGIVEIVDPKTGAPVPPVIRARLFHAARRARHGGVAYRTGDFIDGGLTYEPCPLRSHHAPPRRNIARASEVRAMQFDKIKGTLVDFNQLEHVSTTRRTLAPGFWNSGR